MMRGLPERLTAPINLKVLVIEVLKLDRKQSDSDDGFEGGYTVDFTDLETVTRQAIDTKGHQNCVHIVRLKGMSGQFIWPNGVTGNTDGTPECEAYYGK